MKKLKLFLFAVMTALIAFSGCSKNGGDANDPFSKYEEGWTESGNTSYYKLSKIAMTKADTYQIYLLFTVKFSGTAATDYPTSVICELGCPNAELAKEAYNNMDQEDKEWVTLSGRILKFDLTEDFVQIPRSTIKMIIEQVGAALNI